MSNRCVVTVVLAPGMTVVLAGPDMEYVITGLETSGADAVLHLRTSDGQPWDAPREERQPRRFAAIEDMRADAEQDRG